MANRYGAGVYIRGTSVPFPHSANRQGEDHISVHRAKKHYQWDQRKNRLLWWFAGQIVRFHYLLMQIGSIFFVLCSLLLYVPTLIFSKCCLVRIFCSPVSSARRYNIWALVCSSKSFYLLSAFILCPNMSQHLFKFSKCKLAPHYFLSSIQRQLIFLSTIQRQLIFLSTNQQTIIFYVWVSAYFYSSEHETVPKFLSSKTLISVYFNFWNMHQLLL